MLSPRDIVILDGLNYIKGWRYQLFCEAKNMRTPSAVLQIGCSKEQAQAVNEARLRRQGATTATPGVDATADGEPTADGESTTTTDPTTSTSTPIPSVDEYPKDTSEPYTLANWTNLVFRYEEPNPMTRWDSPLFTLIWDDDAQRTHQTFSQLWDVIAGDAKKPIRPNQSTVQRDKDPGGDYLYILEKETQDIVKKILEKQADEGGGEVSLPRAGVEGEEPLVVELPGKKVGLPQLQRYRRAFVALNRGGIGLEAVGKLAATRLRESFVGYLNDAFEKDG